MRKWYTVNIHDLCRYSEHRRAHHEAGHAVIGRVLGLEGGLVTIVKDDIGDGRAAFPASGTVEARIVMSLAGREAESVFGFDNADNEMTEEGGVRPEPHRFSVRGGGSGHRHRAPAQKNAAAGTEAPRQHRSHCPCATGAQDAAGRRARRAHGQLGR